MADQNQSYTEADLYAMSLDDLRALAQKEAAQPVQTEPQSRDEQGRFKQATQDEQTEEADEPEDEEDEQPKKLYRRVITVEEGVDPEIFEAESMEELIDKIADAKAHATRKIRQQEAELKKTRADQAPKPRQFSEDEEFVYSQELMQKPTQAFAKMFKEMVGMDITQFRTVTEKVNAIEQAKNVNEALVHFLTTHSEYEDTKANADLMTLALQGRERTAENLEKAYQSLVSKGLLQTGGNKQSSVQDAELPSKSGITTKPVANAPTQGTKKASGLKARNTPPAQSSEPSEADLYAMPLDQLKELANRKLQSR